MSQISDDVDRAAADVTELVMWEQRGQRGTVNQAISIVARNARLSAGDVRRLFHPSRRPKDVGMRVVRGIRAAYRRHLQRQLLEIERRIRVVEARDRSDHAERQHLVDEAQALIRRVKDSL